ncbi:hypothetical protein [Pueribacillus sp. YX66]|uniref:hypothetical protein n=1 Tax=Pueribacillus sp. YX66 TaxID=3229242 RepID=UPI00358CE886
MLTGEDATLEQLEEVARQLEEKVDSFMEEIEKTKEVSVRKELRAKRSMFKK